MSESNNISNNTPDGIAAWLRSDVYLKNVDFWNKAWNMVKTPYKQLPDLSYLPDIPEGLKMRAAKRILDLGCGSGWLSIYLAREGFEVTGMDIAENAVLLGRNWAQSESLKVTFAVADINEIPYPDSSFDAVVANSIFEHLTYELALRTLANLAKVLVPGGTFFGCFDKVGGGPGEYEKLSDGTHVYTDKARQGMLLRMFSDIELKDLFADWTIDEIQSTKAGSRLIWARTN